MLILAIDPGTTESAYLELGDGVIKAFGKVSNDELLGMMRRDWHIYNVIAVEHFQSYGMPVGKEVFETAYFCGRLQEIADCGDPLLNSFKRVYRKQVVVHHCNSPKAKDSNIRQAMLDRFGAQGTKKNPGPTYGISKDVWSALAIAAYAVDSFGTHYDDHAGVAS